MSVFRIQGQQTSLKNDIDWFVSSQYKTNEILAIPDPNGGKGSEPTSIPSPFARMDLANSAFSYVNSMGANAGFMYQKIVSDCLDIAEIFFSPYQFGSDIQVVPWDLTDEINALKTANSDEHKQLGQTLEMYLKADAGTFNFDKVDKIYLLKYKHKIIGATSPLTLFFSSANDLSWTKITFANGDKAFDQQLCPLYKRSDEFQLWLYRMRAYYPDFSKTFSELDAYMMKNQLPLLEIYNNQLYNMINGLNNISNTTNYINSNYKQSTIFLIKATKGGNGLPLYIFKSEGIEINSDYEIASTKFSSAPKPLVLMNGHTGKNSKTGVEMIYYTGSYVSGYKVPYNDNRPLDKRTLPGLTNTVYPYLSVGDFLEPYLIRTPYAINSQYFFNGNYNGSITKTEGFLLPIKKTFFEYFDITDLKRIVDGESMFRVDVKSSGNVEVILRIPVANNNYVELKRNYDAYPSKESQPEADNDNNLGIIVDHQFGLGLFPCVKFVDGESPRYRVALVDRDIKKETIQNRYTLKFFNQTDISKEVSIKDSKIRGRKSDSSVETRFDVVNNNFDLIELSINNMVSGLIVPLFKETQRTRKFTFAIDFGTTNTHVEYSIGDEPAKPMEIKAEEQQLAKLYADDAHIFGEITGAFKHDFIPDIISAGTEYSFPIRTVLSVNNTTNFNGSAFALADVNIPFIYERESKREHNEFIPNLKWSNEQHNKKQVECYLDNLMLLIRNKVLINGGSLCDTKIVWFYPASMLKYRHDAYKEIWEKLYLKNFGNNVTENLIEMSESIAPYNLYSKTLGVSDNSITIDIGGGTTDVYFFKNDETKFLTSFRFAANTLFGDGYNYTSDTNGFIARFHEHIRNCIVGDENNPNQLGELAKVLSTIEESKRTSDIIAFYFSLQNNHELKKKSINISFNEMLRDEKSNDFKIVFIFFYTALLYHIATLMKAKSLPLPRHITFSGTGSKTLQILTRDKKTLQDFTKLVFAKIYNETYTTPLDIIQNADNPKEVTCKGGIKVPIKQAYGDIDLIKTTLLGTDNSTFISEGLVTKYDNLPEIELKKLENEAIKAIEFIFDLNKSFSFNKNFGASASGLDSVKALCLQDIRKYIDEGLKLKRKEIELYNGDQNIEESLFFYPLVGIINAIVRNIKLKE